VYVADSGNARVDEFGPGGGFIAAFGWGVADGKAQAEVCTSTCQAGIAGSGPGQFSRPTSISFGVPGGPSAGKVFIGDSGNNVVEEYDADGNFVRTIDGTTTPQGHFQSVVGVAVDQSGNVWVADGSTDNITEYNPNGAFVQQWNDTYGSTEAIAVDSTHGKVYLIRGTGATESWTLNGKDETAVDNGSGTALAIDPGIGNLYVDHGGDVATYNPGGGQVDSLTLSTSNSHGLAFRSGAGNPHGQFDLYVSDASANNLTVYSPPTTTGSPIVAGAAETGTGATSATLSASVVAHGLATTCTFQYVDHTDFLASGFTNATSVPCTPSVGSGFTFQFETANVTGLTAGAFYHFRVVATNSAGTTTSATALFQVGPGAWTPFNRCPVDDPTMLAATGGQFSLFGGGGTGTTGLCVGSSSPNGSIKIGNLTTPTTLTDLQVGEVSDNTTGTFTSVSPSGGAIVEDPVQLSTPIGPVTAVTESAGTPSNFSLVAGIETGVPIITLPIKIQLENPTLGPSCFIGSDANPIVLQPENTDISNASATAFEFDPNGTPDPNGPLTTIVVNGAVQSDTTFAVPGATGCGPNGDGSLDAAVNAIAGLPSASGNNSLVLNDASSALVLPLNLLSGTTLNGQQFAADWHVAFGG
jgi:hypothetical protein